MVDKDGIITQIEELLGAEGSRALAEAMFPILQGASVIMWHEQTGYEMEPIEDHDAWMAFVLQADESLPPVTFEVRTDGGASQLLEADSMEYAVEEAKEWLAEGWEPEDSTQWVHGRVRKLDRAGNEVEGESITIEIDPREPACETGHEHDWQSPWDIVGGCKESPGVYGHGGGVTIQEVCIHCGCGRLTDTWAQDSYNGRQGLESVTYEAGKFTVPQENHGD